MLSELIMRPCLIWGVQGQKTEDGIGELERKEKKGGEAAW